MPFRKPLSSPQIQSAPPLTYQGTWDADTNTPFLESGGGTPGDLWIVAVAGSTDLDGITDWQVGDMAIRGTTAYQKIDNTETVYDFQTVYDVSTGNPKIVLTAVNGGIGIRDAATPIMGDLIYVSNNAADTIYGAISAKGIQTDKRFIPSSNREVLAGDKVLAEGDAQYQFLDSGPADRNVDLPVADTNMFFVVSNIGATNNLIVRDNGGTPIGDALISGEEGKYYYDGTAWHRINTPQPPIVTPVTAPLTVTSNGQTVFTLPEGVNDIDNFVFWLNGQAYPEHGVHFTISGTTLIWLDPDGITLVTTDEVYVSYNKPVVVSGEIKYSIQIATDYNNTYNGVRNRSIGGTGNHQFTFTIPPDFKKPVSIYIIAMVTGGADQTNRNIDLFSVYGKPLVEPYNQHVESDITTLYNFTGLNDRYVKIDLLPVLSNIEANDIVGLNIDHNGIGGALKYVQIEILYN